MNSKFNLLVNEIKDFNSSYEPKSIRIIVGKELQNIHRQSEFEVTKSIPIYALFGHCAFIVEGAKTSLNDAECNVWALLFNCSLEESKDFLNHIKQLKLENSLIEWLYRKHGVVMINRKGFSQKFKYLRNVNITHVLIISEYSHQKVLKVLDNDTKVAIVSHPSKREYGIFKSATWKHHNDKYLKTARYSGFTFGVASLKDFMVY